MMKSYRQKALSEESLGWKWN